MPGSSVLHCLLEFAQTDIQGVGAKLLAYYPPPFLTVSATKGTMVCVLQKTPLDCILSARRPAVPREASLSADRVVRSEEENGAGPALPCPRTPDSTEGTGLARVCTARPWLGPRMKSTPPHQGSAPGPLPFCTLPWGWGSAICACTPEAVPTRGLGEPSWLEERVPSRLLPTAASAPHPLGAV